MEAHGTLADYGAPVSANAYLGTAALLPALETGADIVITGRVADPSLFARASRRTISAGRSMISTGWRAAPASDTCSNARASSPAATSPIRAARTFRTWRGSDFRTPTSMPTASAMIGKVDGTGGAISLANAKEQLLYEVTDPHGYVTPDVIADFSSVALARGRRPTASRSPARAARSRPAQLKVSVGYHAGYVGEGEIGYGGANALRARGLPATSSASGSKASSRNCASTSSAARRCMVERSTRASVRTKCGCASRRAQRRAELAAIVGEEVEALYTNGPAGGGGARKYVHEQIGIVSTLDRSRARAERRSRCANGRRMPKLYDLAHCRAGDKGNTSILSLIAYRAGRLSAAGRARHRRRGARAPARHRARRDHSLRAAASSGHCNSCATHALGRRRHDVACARLARQVAVVSRCSKWISRPESH